MDFRTVDLENNVHLTCVLRGRRSANRDRKSTLWCAAAFPRADLHHCDYSDACFGRWGEYGDLQRDSSCAAASVGGAGSGAGGFVPWEVHAVKFTEHWCLRA